MENLHINALKPLQNPYPFPPRRRLLMSETYSTLLQILTNCSNTDSTTDKQKLDDNGSSKLGKENEVSELVDHHLIRSKNSLVTGPAHKESDNLVLQRCSGDGNKGSSRNGYKDFTGAQMEVDLDHSNHVSDAIEGDKGDSISNDIMEMSCLVDRTLGYDNQIVKEPGNRCSTHESEVKELDPIRQVEIDKEPSIDDVSAAVEFCFGEDAIADMSQPAELSGEEKMDVSEKYFSEEMKHGLRVKEVELEKLISSAGATDSSVHVPVREQMEEGEAFGDFMVFDESDYDILNRVGDEKKDEADKSPDIFGREEFAFDAHVNAPQRRDVNASSSINAVDEDNTLFGGELIKKVREETKDNMEKVSRSKVIETRKICVYDTILDIGNVAEQVGGDVKLDHPTGSQFRSTSDENAKKREYLVVAAENENIGKKEKKRGPSSKERKAMKKAKKRAEQYRKLGGGKRLKLLPVVKPKVVKYCRHYLKGRCFEGEKCKFSHDTTPLTKSKPCVHFARQSCMKGDDCPFDHELFKYLCDNYASQGFCNRGAGCLFSHEITAKTAAVASPITSNRELMSPSAPSNSNSLIKVNTSGLSHKDVNSISGSAGLVPGKSTEQTVLGHVRKPASCTPKGVTFLSRGKSLQGDAKKHEEAGSSSKTDDGKFSCQIIHSKSDNIQKPNGFMQGASMRTPQGMNFLSFGRAPSADPSGDTLSGMLNMDYGVDKLQLVGMKANISAKLGSMNQMSTRTPPGSVSPCVNLLSVDKAVKDRLHPNEFNSSSSSIHRRQNAPNTTSSEMPFRQLSSLFPAGQSLIQSTQKCNAEIASSSKAPFLANTSSSIQKALQSTLAFAAKFDVGVKYGMSNGSPVISSAINHKAGSSKDR